MKKLALSLIATLQMVTVYADVDSQENRNEQLETEMKEMYAKLISDFFPLNIPRENKTEIDILAENVGTSLAQCYSRDKNSCDQLLIDFAKFDVVLREKWIKTEQEAQNEAKKEALTQMNAEAFAKLDDTKASLERLVQITKELSDLPN